jgi:hypothetical protein
MTQLSLLDAPASRYAVTDVCGRKHRGSETSEAANPTRESKAEMRQRIRWYLRQCERHGGTWAEISEALGIAYANSGRISEMKTSGEVVESGERRPTPSGHSAFVVVLKEFLS